MLGKSPIKLRQRPDMTIAVDWDVQHQFKQTNNKKQTCKWNLIFYKSGRSNTDDYLRGSVMDSISSLYIFEPQSL